MDEPKMKDKYDPNRSFQKSESSPMHSYHEESLILILLLFTVYILSP